MTDDGIAALLREAWNFHPPPPSQDMTREAFIDMIMDRYGQSLVKGKSREELLRLLGN